MPVAIHEINLKCQIIFRLDQKIGTYITTDVSILTLMYNSIAIITLLNVKICISDEEFLRDLKERNRRFSDSLPVRLTSDLTSGREGAT